MSLSVVTVWMGAQASDNKAGLCSEIQGGSTWEEWERGICATEEGKDCCEQDGPKACAQ